MAVTAKSFDALLFLVEHRGRLVRKDDLLKALWPNVFVDETNLAQAISVLRKALGESGSDQRYIVTVPGLGYRFAANVTQPAATASSDSAMSHPGSAAPPRPAASRWILLAAGAVMLVASLAIYFQWSRSRGQPRVSSARIMLAVLPFENLTGDAAQDYFSDGLTEEMISQLGRLDSQHLAVIARTSVMHYKGSRQPLAEIGRELGVQYVLEGSVRRDSHTVRVSAQLIQMKDQTHVWAREYDREISSLLTLQGEIAQEVADEIELTLGGERHLATNRQPAALSPQSLEAYDLYLKGRYFWNKRTPQGFQQAIESFQQAVVKDPNYARAYAGLADSYAMVSTYFLASPLELMPKARAAALRALQIDDKLAEAHTSLALITENYDYDWQTAEKEFRRAIELDPNYATARQWYAECLAFQGRFDEALVQSELARQLDPLSPIIRADNASILYFSRRYDSAIERFRAVLSMEPNSTRGQTILYAYVEKGRFGDALAEVEDWRRSDDTPWTWAMQAYIYGRAGQQAQARHALGELETATRRQKLDFVPMFVVAYAGIGRADDAFRYLEMAYAERSSFLLALKVDPVFDSLRADPRFGQLLRRIGLAQ